MSVSLWSPTEQPGRKVTLDINSLKVNVGRFIILLSFKQGILSKCNQCAAQPRRVNLEPEQFISMSPAWSKQPPRKGEANSGSQLQKPFVRGKIYQDLGMDILFQNIAQQRWAKWVLVVVSKCVERKQGRSNTN